MKILILQRNFGNFLSGSYLSRFNFLSQVHSPKVISQIPSQNLQDFRTPVTLQIMERKQGNYRGLWWKGWGAYGGRGGGYPVTEAVPSLHKWAIVKSPSSFLWGPRSYHEGEIWLCFLFFIPLFLYHPKPSSLHLTEWRVALAAGSATICDGQVWRLHHHMDSGQTGYVLKWST